MNSRLVSIIVPYYNRELYLFDCINSILTQSYQNLELLLIDDGSTDNSSTIAHTFNDARISHYQLKHQGCWSIKNFGIKQAKGEFVLFVDSDDMISPQYLQIAIDTAIQHPEYDYFYETAIDIIKADGELTNVIWRYLDYQENDKYKLINLFYEHQIGGIPHAGALIKKQVFETYGHYEELVNLSDTVYIVKNAFNIKFFMIKNLRHYYNRQHDLQTNKNAFARNKAYADLLFYVFETYSAKLISPYLADLKPKEIYQSYFDKLISCAEKAEIGKEFYMDYAKYYLTKIRELEE